MTYDNLDFHTVLQKRLDTRKIIKTGKKIRKSALVYFQPVLDVSPVSTLPSGFILTDAPVDPLERFCG